MNNSKNGTLNIKELTYFQVTVSVVKLFSMYCQCQYDAIVR